jgi:hypothetical protein
LRAHVCGAAVANDRPLYRDRFDAPDVGLINAGSGIQPLSKYLKFGPFWPAALARASVALQRTPTVLPITAVSRKIIARVRARKTCARYGSLAIWKNNGALSCHAGYPLAHESVNATHSIGAKQ